MMVQNIAFTYYALHPLCVQHQVNKQSVEYNEIANVAHIKS